MDTPSLHNGVASKLIPAGIILVFVGILLVFVGVFYSIMRNAGKGEYGGVVVIGPLPIVFGSSSEAVKIAVIGAIVIMVLALIIMLLPLLAGRSIMPTR
ncbi:hypothetical protein Pyrde_1142 [Pyrodictium delaneyi]|uniref:TIGR00304 family protein n=1 Tax=Pyrodictium delaneyi TaxID=1273541 RepID=A0A0P0N448_9CREN|nr:DUF131 domain-containing protein [Pyrodictium delaneyi]ALL01190.1 hypothetical protein Pyrde_1142 [Pyrodictium delaneyi]OWJ55730.1 TIGR00304 family protein [Pyrodictium delaneyi]